MKKSNDECQFPIEPFNCFSEVAKKHKLYIFCCVGQNHHFAFIFPHYWKSDFNYGLINVNSLIQEQFQCLQQSFSPSLPSITNPHNFVEYHRNIFSMRFVGNICFKCLLLVFNELSFQTDVKTSGSIDV